MLEQNTKEWLDKRKNYVTSTDASILMGVNPWKTPHQLWCEKMDLTTPTQENEAMREGRRLEPFARELFISHTGIQIRPDVRFQGHLMASLDGITDKGEMVVEIKCGKGAFDRAKENVIPDYYKAQMQHQMATADAERAIYFAFWDNAYVSIDVDRDQKWIDEYLPISKEFHNCLINFDPPEMKENDFFVLENAEDIEILKQLAIIHEHTKMLKESADSLKNRLFAKYGDKNIRSGGLKLSKVVTKGRVDYDAIPEVACIDLEKYRKPSTISWRLTKGGL